MQILVYWSQFVNSPVSMNRGFQINSVYVFLTIAVPVVLGILMGWVIRVWGSISDFRKARKY
jgi:hypothetical protein